MLERVEGLDQQIVEGIRHGRTAYDDPGTLLMKLRMDEPEEFAACAGAGVQGLVPDLADFWKRYLVAARDRGEIHPDTDIDEASEWVARVLLSLATVPGDTLDAQHVERFVLVLLAHGLVSEIEPDGDGTAVCVEPFGFGERHGGRPKKGEVLGFELEDRTPLHKVEH